MEYVIFLAPIAAAAYYTSSAKSDQNAMKKKKDLGNNGDWISDNNWVYLENPIQNPYAIPGDSDQISLEKPMGQVQDAMAAQQNPIQALSILANHEREKDRAIIGLWTEYIRPSREIVTRSVDQPITQVNILQPGGLVDQKIKIGNRFWDEPVPRSTGTDRYYKRDITVPYYLVP